MCQCGFMGEVPRVLTSTLRATGVDFVVKKNWSRGTVRYYMKASSTQQEVCPICLARSVLMYTQVLNTVLPAPVSPASGPPWGDWR